MNEISTTIIRNDPLRQLGQKVQKAIDLAIEQEGGSVQISYETPDGQLMYVSVRHYIRRF